MKIDSRYLSLLVIEWKQKYGTPKPTSFSPINILAFRKCEKYGCSIANIAVHRHHTGYESLLARIYPDVYAPRYLLFHKDDIALVCEKHHSHIHEKVYDPIVRRFMRKFMCSQPTVEDCEELRKTLKAACIKYLDRGRQNGRKEMDTRNAKEVQRNNSQKKKRKKRGSKVRNGQLASTNKKKVANRRIAT